MVLALYNFSLFCVAQVSVMPHDGANAYGNLFRSRTEAASVLFFFLIYFFFSRISFTVSFSSLALGDVQPLNTTL